MSYDVHFLRREPGQSWDDAMDALGEGDERVSPEDRAAWARVVARLRTELPDLEADDPEDDPDDADDSDGEGGGYELVHHATGLQLALYGDELSLTVPYWSEGDEARRVGDLLRRVAVVVEQETGRTAYDPQLDAPLLEADPAQTSAVLDEVRGALRDRLGPDLREQRRVPWWRRLLGGGRPG